MKKTFSPSVTSVDFDLRQLEIFRKVVELGSFSKAAEAVHLAQASVSERIATLESMVGAKLLDRMGRKVVATRAGELLLQHAQRLLEMKKTACLEMQDFLGMKQGEIRIGCSTIPGEYIVPNVIGRFCEHYPLATVSLTIADSRQIETRVLEGRFEIGMIGFRSTARSLIAQELWKDELVLAVPASHPWAARKTVSIQELSRVPYISRESGSGTLKMVEEYLHASGAKGVESLRVIARFGTSTAVKEGIKAGLGVSILSALALDTEIKAGILKPLRLKGLRMPRRFYLIRDRRRSASPLCKAFIDYLLNCAKKNADPQASKQ